MQAEKVCFCGKSRKLLMMRWCFDRARVWFCVGVAVFLLTYPVFWGRTYDCGSMRGCFLAVMGALGVKAGVFLVGGAIIL